MYFLNSTMVNYPFKILLLFVLIIAFSCKSLNIKSPKTQSKDIVFIEAESTTSNLAKWVKVSNDDNNYVVGASNNTYLEFMGNQPITGKANSPLEYQFIALKTGVFQLMLMTSKRLEGVKSDWCNDAFVKLSGDFDSANTLTTEDLKTDIKILQDGNDETPELEWHWASTAEKDRHVYNQFIYNLNKGEKYKLTLSGRSMRFSIDYIVFYNIDKVNKSQLQELLKSK